MDLSMFPWFATVAAANILPEEFISPYFTDLFNLIFIKYSLVYQNCQLGNTAAIPTD